MGSRQRILFVDDEENLLDGLRNVLRKRRHEWDMVFANSGEAALDEMRKAPFDVVVSDMRMPTMDGATLLTMVKDAYPATARIILSGQAEREALIRALPVADQFLSKPCDGEVLRTVIERACALKHLLQDQTIRDAVSQLVALPSSGHTYRELTKALSDSDVGLSTIAQIIERDPAMSAKVLQLVNSPFFGLAKSVTSISQAAVYLGADAIKGLVLTSHVFSMIDAKSACGLSLEHLQEHSLMTARLAKRLITTPTAGEDAFTAALLHDIGQIALAVAFPERFTTALATSRRERRPLHEVEYEHLGVSHAEVGAHLLGVWGLPFLVVEAVAYHHRPASVHAGDRAVLAAVHLADTIVEASEDEEGTTGGLDVAFLEASGWAAAIPAAREWTAIERLSIADARPAGRRERGASPRTH